MARNKRRPTRRARSTGQSVPPVAEDLEDPTADGEDAAAELADDAASTDTSADDSAADDTEADDAADAPSSEDPKDSDGSEDAEGSTDSSSTPARPEDPPRKKRKRKDAAPAASGASQDPVKKRTPGGEVPEKAKDAEKSPSAKKAAAAETARAGTQRVAVSSLNPPWLAPTGVTLLILGLVYLVTYYLSAGALPLPIGDWNIAVGFGVLMVGGGMFMFWK